MFTAFSKTLTAGSLIREHRGAQKLRGSEILLERIAALAEVFVFDMWICRLVVQLVGHPLFYRNSVFSCFFMALCLR